MSWDRDASALYKMDQKDLEEGKPVCTSLELEDMIDRGRALVPISHLTYLEHKTPAFVRSVFEASRPEVNSATRARWVRWVTSSDEIVPAKRLKLPV